jgi:hypothetical protein
MKTIFLKHNKLSKEYTIFRRKQQVEKVYHRIMQIFYKRLELWLLIATTLISISALLVFFFSGQKNLADYDAIARLNIARKVFDSLTPGFGQLGGIWLPFPQVLFMPFIWNDFLWHTGLAGAFVSMISFILSSAFLYKTVNLITGTVIGGFLAWLIYVTNVNMLLLQSMAMSESFFLFTLIMIIYFLTRWAKSRNILFLFCASVFVILTTLTRYEGYALFGAATLSVAAVTLLTTGKASLKRLEGTLIIFITLAGFGIFTWAVYSFLIFKDPIYWLNLYTGNKNIIALDPTDVSKMLNSGIHTAKNISIPDAFKIYGSAMIFMNSVLLSLMAIIGFIYLIITAFYHFIKNKTNVLVLPIIIVTCCVLLFLIIGYQKGLIPLIETPFITFANLFDKSKNFASSSNIRYGIIILPLISLIVGIVYSKTRYLFAVALIVLSFQIYSLFTGPLFLTFSLPTKISYNEFDSSEWLRENYDSGLILVSANRHENFMFQTNLPYRNFIYEGNRKWWRDSLKDPSKYARWVVFDENESGDAVNQLITDKTILTNKFEIAYQDKTMKIYKIK